MDHSVSKDNEIDSEMDAQTRDPAVVGDLMNEEKFIYDRKNKCKDLV